MVSQVRGERVVYVKRHGDRTEADWVRVERLYAASRRSERFAAARPILRDTVAGTITYERLPDGVPLRRLVYRCFLSRAIELRRRVARLVDGAGEALADYHRLASAGGAGGVLELVVAPAPGLLRPHVDHLNRCLRQAPVCAMHGDYWPANLWVVGDDLVLLDPLPTPYCPDQTAEAAPIYYDIAHMLFALWAMHPLWIYPVFRDGFVSDLGNRFIEGYERRSRLSVSRAAANTLAVWLYERYLRSVPARLAPPLAWLRTRAAGRNRRRLVAEAMRLAAAEGV